MASAIALTRDSLEKEAAELITEDAFLDLAMRELAWGVDSEYLVDKQ